MPISPSSRQVLLMIVLIDARGVIKLADFGLGKVLLPGISVAQSFVGVCTVISVFRTHLRLSAICLL